jgi:hypothetical protein
MGDHSLDELETILEVIRDELIRLTATAAGPEGT